MVPQVCNVIWKRLQPIYMKAPNDPESWRTIADNFWQKWQFPHCLGAIDGKHVVVTKPWNSGSLFYNYKGTCSIVLLALVDANYRFLLIDVGSFGRNSDSGIFSRCRLGRKIKNNGLSFPEPDPLPNYAASTKVPYVVVGDEAFPLLQNLLRPYPGKENSLDKQLFNYRLSRSRRVVENAFGILAARWRVFHTKIMLAPDRVNSVLLASCALHNFLQSISTVTENRRLLQEAPNLNEIEGLRNTKIWI